MVRAGISDAAASLLEFMSTMGTGEAIAFGEGVALPTRIKFDMLRRRLPKSNTASFTKNWAMDLPDDSFLHEIVHRWRAQSHNPDGAGYSADGMPRRLPRRRRNRCRSHNRRSTARRRTHPAGPASRQFAAGTGAASASTPPPQPQARPIPQPATSKASPT